MPDSNDTRMQQVMYANGKLWGALDTALTVDSHNRTGIEWFIVNPSAGKLLMQGYLGMAGMDFTYPAIGVTTSGRGVMAFSATGEAKFPSAAYAPIDAKGGVGAWNIVPGGEGAAVDDGFTSYKSQVGNPPRTRWGDYRAAVVDGNSSGSPVSILPAPVITPSEVGLTLQVERVTTCWARVHRRSAQLAHGQLLAIAPLMSASSCPDAC